MTGSTTVRAMTEVTRIGRGVPGARQPRPQQRLPLQWWLAFGAFGALLVFLGSIYVFGGDDREPAVVVPTEAVVNQIECESVRKAYAEWYADKGELTHLFTDEGARAFATASGLNEAAHAFERAATGYPDQPAKDLAAVAAKYTVETELLELETVGSGKVTPSRHASAMEAWATVERYYAAFMLVTCKVSN